MHEEFGVAFASTGAAIFYAITIFILSRRDKDMSHYFFALLTFSSGSSELLSVFEFTGTMELAHFLLKFDLSFIALAIYSYFMFADYFREGFNKKTAIIALIPTIIVIIILHTVMIEGMVQGPYGWAGKYNPLWNLVYAGYSIAYLIIVTIIFLNIYRQVTESGLRKKIGLLLAGSLVLLGGALINEPLLELMNGRIFPIVETALMVASIIFAIAISGKINGSDSQ